MDMGTILIVDDEPIIRQLFQNILEREGHAVLVASNGREAIEMMRQRIPNLVMLDLQMPVMDGMSFLRLLRRHPDWMHVPVVIMSALADKQEITSAGSLGVKDYLLKAGFSLPEMRARIGKYFTPAEVESEEVIDAALDLEECSEADSDSDHTSNVGILVE
jgi:CheY-like chemotaxis protein